jgi:uncharacterized SAM-binding protein YcdF (DUF218 family)
MFGDASELMLPTTPYLCAVLLVLCIAAFRRRDTRFGRARWLLVVMFAWSWIFSTPRVANRLAVSLESRYPLVEAPVREGDPLIVVLSSGSIAGNGATAEPRLDEAGWARTFGAIRLWRAVGGHLLFVGEPTPNHRSSVARAMADVAITAGVPAGVIAVENDSLNTYQNLTFSRATIAAAGANSWLVTSAMHMPRAMAVARKLGLPLRPYPCDVRAAPMLHWYSWLPDAAGPSVFRAALHEWIGLAWYRLRGRAE